MLPPPQGDDEALFPLVSLVNAACGFHGSDFDVMAKTAALARQHGVGIGAHPSLPGASCSSLLPLLRDHPKLT